MERVLLPKQDAADLLINGILNLIDMNRGEMNRLEFISLLIRSKLEKYRRNYNHTDEEEICLFVKEVMEILSTYKEVMEILSTYLEFFYKAKLSNVAESPEYYGKGPA